MKTIKINISDQQLMKLNVDGQIIINIGNKKNELTDDTKGNEDFIDIIVRYANSLQQTGNLRTAETYLAAKNQLQKFRDETPLPLKAVTQELMDRFQSYLRSRNLTKNSISFNMRILRSAYNRAVREGLVEDALPFKFVYTGQDKTAKRALTTEQLRNIARLKIDDHELRFARDLFIMSFYLRGMSFVDMAYLKTSNLRDGILTYKRRKTGQKLTIGWEEPMQAIVERYHQPSSPYLLPIIHHENGKERNQYRHQQTKVNVLLKEVARRAGISQNLTMYCARHTWATTARELQVPMNIISRAMGHTDEKTTEIYIRSVDSSAVDRVNRQIIDLI